MTKAVQTKSQKRQDARHAQILDAAAACFVKEGFHGTSMSKVAAEAKMSVGHIYHYFASKEEIILALVEREQEQTLVKVSEALTIPAEDLVEGFTERLSDSLCNHATPFQSILNHEILAEAQRNPKVAEKVYETDAMVREIFTKMFRERLGIEDCEARIEAMSAMFHGLGSRTQRNPNIDIDGLLPITREFLRQIFGK